MSFTRYFPLRLSIRSLIVVLVSLVLLTRYLSNKRNDEGIIESDSNSISLTENDYQDLITVSSSFKDSGLAGPSNDKESLYKFIEPEVAGSGSYEEEMARIKQFVSTQQAICVNIKRMGGAIKRPIFQFDPDGVWPVCLDKETGINPYNCTVYSFGINDEWSFDEAMEKFGCEVYAFDPTMGVGEHQHSPKIKFYNIGLGDNDTDPVVVDENGNTRGLKLRKLETIIKLLNHSERIIDVLKMDIELWEWKSLSQIMESDILRRQVKQLNVEYHVASQNPHKIRRNYGICKWLERQGFLLIHKHQNAVCASCFEMTYVNINLVKLKTHQNLY